MTMMTIGEFGYLLGSGTCSVPGLLLVFIGRESMMFVMIAGWYFLLTGILIRLIPDSSRALFFIASLSLASGVLCDSSSNSTARRTFCASSSMST